MVLIAVIAVALALLRAAPELGAFVAALGIPAWVRTWFVLDKRRSLNQATGPDQMLLVFVSSLCIVFMTLVAIVSFFAAAFAAGFGAICGLGFLIAGQAWELAMPIGLIVGTVTGLAGAGFVIHQLVRMSERGARHAPRLRQPRRPH
jgi:hypothetical protein